MPEVKKNAISFKSSNGTDIVAGYYYTCPGMEPRCILQISHGMCEYIGRYDDFAGYNISLDHFHGTGLISPGMVNQQLCINTKRPI